MKLKIRIDKSPFQSRIRGAYNEGTWRGREKYVEMEANEEQNHGHMFPLPTSFSSFLEKDLRRKESVQWVNMVLGSSGAGI
ncbi:hypothetical protein ISN44_As11g030520 [Arabidopsis suecica]|uniref:Uncharacterized protein n=1 Tax=Arabidopsis suecica TaxID=45249 RepID=A0A8T1ZDI2_ARASU|nr:hypothetical protein ISN44_As11g030520 [Arabidopsis suecica]